MTNAEIDHAVLSVCHSHWRKVAMIIWKAARILPELPDNEDTYRMIARRIEALVDSDRLQSQGDLSRWRYSEVRILPETELSTQDSEPRTEAPLAR